VTPARRYSWNPVLWDSAAQAWTAAGVSYLARLDALTGPRKLRLRHGRWVQAEGVVYEGWEPAIHVVDRFPIPTSWPRYWSVDFGYTHPFVCLFVAEDPDGRLYIYREIYRTKRLVEDHAKQMLLVSQADPRPRMIVCDHDAEDRATLERHLHLPTLPAWKEVSPGIQAVAARLKVHGDGRPRLFVLRDSLVERDQELVEAKKPISITEEFDSYIWQMGGTARNKGEVPVKDADHGMDSCRYLVATIDCGNARVGWGRSGKGTNSLSSLPAGVFG
jgi:hypothetical protein